MTQNYFVAIILTNYAMIPNERKIPKLLPKITALALWSMTVALGAYSVWAILETLTVVLLSLPLYGIAKGQLVNLSGAIAAIRWGVWVVGGIGWLTVTIGGFEYHSKRLGRFESWRLFAWTIGIEAALIMSRFLLPLIFQIGP